MVGTSPDSLLPLRDKILHALKLLFACPKSCFAVECSSDNAWVLLCFAMNKHNGNFKLNTSLQAELSGSPSLCAQIRTSA